jgi:hypothetical protein
MLCPADWLMLQNRPLPHRAQNTGFYFFAGLAERALRSLDLGFDSLTAKATGGFTFTTGTSALVFTIGTSALALLAGTGATWPCPFDNLAALAFTRLSPNPLSIASCLRISEYDFATSG